MTVLYIIAAFLLAFTLYNFFWLSRPQCPSCGSRSVEDHYMFGYWCRRCHKRDL